MVPSAVSSAAPTLKCEKSARAWSRTARAAEMRSSIFESRIPDPESRPDSCLESLNDSLEQRDERAANAVHGCEDVFVNDGLRQQPCRQIRDAGDAENLHPHVTRGNRFGNGRHADRVGAHAAEEP